MARQLYHFIKKLPFNKNNTIYRSICYESDKNFLRYIERIMSKLNIFVYPGSFDPVTNGHIDIIDRAVKMCDKLIVAVLINNRKKPTFTLEERIEFLETVLKGRSEIEIASFSGLTVDFLKKNNAKVIVRGLRAISDFENEFQMALINKELVSSIETIFMMTRVDYAYLSSSAVKELAMNKGKIDGMVPECIKDIIMNKFNNTTPPTTL